MGMWSDITNSYSLQPCVNCKQIEIKGQWWYLNGYYGINGYFCPKCFELVSHNSYGIPNHPDEYSAIKIKQSKQL